jgi:hypothetical protein
VKDETTTARGITGIKKPAEDAEEISVAPTVARNDGVLLVESEDHAQQDPSRGTGSEMRTYTDLRSGFL